MIQKDHFRVRFINAIFISVSNEFPKMRTAIFEKLKKELWVEDINVELIEKAIQH